MTKRKLVEMNEMAIFDYNLIMRESHTTSMREIDWDAPKYCSFCLCVECTCCNEIDEIFSENQQLLLNRSCSITPIDLGSGSHFTTNYNNLKDSIWTTPIGSNSSPSDSSQSGYSSETIENYRNSYFETSNGLSYRPYAWSSPIRNLIQTNSLNSSASSSSGAAGDESSANYYSDMSREKPIPANLLLLFKLNNIAYPPPSSRYFVIKSTNEKDIQSSFLHSIWSSTSLGNKRLNSSFLSLAPGSKLYLFFSVNSSGQFCGIAEMLSSVDFEKSAHVWSNDKWKGQFSVSWIKVAYLENRWCRDLKCSLNQNKPIVTSRDTQELDWDCAMGLFGKYFCFAKKESFLDNMGNL